MVYRFKGWFQGDKRLFGLAIWKTNGSAETRMKVGGHCHNANRWQYSSTLNSRLLLKWWDTVSVRPNPRGEGNTEKYCPPPLALVGTIQTLCTRSCPPQARAIKLCIALALVKWSHAGGSYIIFVIFLHMAHFWLQFFSTQKRVNRDKTDFTVKQRKPLINWFGNKTG